MRRSTLWFLLTAAWGALLALNLLRRHYNLNTLVIALAVAAFVALGVVFRRREAKQPPRQPRFK
ncbi:MAG TPA: hypothetical protein VME86_12555 [Acidobacteriaceae bacterium]|nr:hypothetical protein [Acidobacteriaceae bacterium]